MEILFENIDFGSTAFLLRIIMIVLIYAIYKVAANIIRGQNKHLADEEINDYLHGRIKNNTAESRKITAHLGVCEQCRDKMLEK